MSRLKNFDIGEWFFVIFMISLMVACGKNESESSSLNAASGSLALPSSQVKFIEIVSSAQKDSRKAENEMQLKEIKAQRDRALCVAFLSPLIDDWTGTIKKIDSNSDGKGVLEISIAPDIQVKTWDDAFLDIGDRTLIDPGSPIFTAVSAMKEGQRVSFSGRIFKGKGSDCVKESNLSLRRQVEEPEFIFKFSKVSNSVQ